MSNEPMEGSETQPEEQSAPAEQAGLDQGQPVTEGEFSAGGKDFGSLDDLRSAYTELQKGFTQKTQDHAAYRKQSDQYQKAFEEIQADPKLVDHIRGYYDTRVKEQGQTAPQEAQLSSDDSARMARIELQFETQDLQRTHPELSQGDLRDIYGVAAELSEKMETDVPLEHAYVQWAWKNKGSELYQKGLSDKTEELRKGRSAATTQPVGGGERTREKFNTKAPGDERRNHIDSLFKSKGIDLSSFSGD